jgi:hypothetical protein
MCWRRRRMTWAGPTTKRPRMRRSCNEGYIYIPPPLLLLLLLLLFLLVLHHHHHLLLLYIVTLHSNMLGH